MFQLEIFKIATKFAGFKQVYKWNGSTEKIKEKVQNPFWHFVEASQITINKTMFDFEEGRDSISDKISL